VVGIKKESEVGIKKRESRLRIALSLSTEWGSLSDSDSIRASKNVKDAQAKLARKRHLSVMRAASDVFASKSATVGLLSRIILTHMFHDLISGEGANGPD
jgi:hypothetical protein